MGHIDDRLRELGISLPPPRAPLANYVPARRVGNLVYTAGQVSGSAEREIKGKLGDSLDVEQGRQAARVCALNCLAALLTGNTDAASDAFREELTLCREIVARRDQVVEWIMEP